MVHGDLNISNVALDCVGAEIHAYIIDASGIRKGLNVWDLAMLEVTALLHQPLEKNESLVKNSAALFVESVSSSGALDFTTGGRRARNTLRLIAEIRKQVLQMADPQIYALMLFDHALIQLGGLIFRSKNKITNPLDAVSLTAHAVNLLTAVAPEWMT